MDERLEFVTLALARGANVRELCRRYGVSPDVAYKWIRRFKAQGVAGLADRSRRPRCSPDRSAPALEAAVVSVRKENPTWGGRKIRKVLQRDGADGVKLAAVPAASTITGILRRSGLLVRDPLAPPPGPMTRFAYEGPNMMWQADYKGHVALGDGGRCHPLTVIDDHSRFCLALRACVDEGEATVHAEFTEVFRRYGLPEKILCDNGSPWGSAGEEDRYTAIEVWLMRLGVRVCHGRPRHPQTQGKDERFHRTLKAELLARQDLRSLDQAQRLFDPWRDRYNAVRPHEALGLETPATRYRVSPRAFPERLPDPGYQPGEQTRRVGMHGRLSYAGRVWKIGRAFDGEVLALRESERDGIMNVCLGPHVVAELDLALPSEPQGRLAARQVRPLAALAPAPSEPRDSPQPSKV